MRGKRVIALVAAALVVGLVAGNVALRMERRGA